MSEQPLRDERHTLPVEQARQVDQVCNAFEVAWQAGLHPRPESFLADLPEPARSVLARELILLDIDYRRLAGETPQPADYLPAFPNLDPAWLAAALAAPSGSLSAQAPVDEDKSADQPPAAAPSLAPEVRRIRCPHCHNPIQLLDDRPAEVLCPGCGSSFRVRDARPTSTTSGTRPLGKFQLLERVGLGAFGAVWKARDTELDRIVALKIPHTGLLTAGDELERFQREARAAAQLRHPGIVTVHAVETLEGLPTIVADFIEGVPLRALLEVRRPTFREAAALVADVAEAVDFAHQKGLVHRDLKPANIMIEAGRGAPGGLGRPLVMDFGLALRGEAEVTLTLDGQVLGTPAYMSPEQAAGKGHQSDARSDVYSLGVILYELLTGELPFRGSRMMMIHQVLHEEPRPPRKLNDKIPRDLETICLKCLEKEPGRRYTTARALTEDLRRFLSGEPITARPAGAVERGLKWARRRPAAAGLLGLAALVVVGLTGGGWWYSQQEHERAGREASLRQAADDKAVELAQQKDAEKERSARLQYAVDMTIAQRAWENNNVAQVLDLLNAHVSAPGEPDRRGWEWHYQNRLCQAALRTLKGHTSYVYSVAYSPDGTKLASASDDKTIRVWDAATGQELRVLLGHTEAVYSVAYSPDGTRLASASADGTVRLWDADTRQEPRTFKGHSGPVYGVAYSVDGTRLASAGDDKTVRLWDATTGQELRTLRRHMASVCAVAYSPDGTRLASASNDKTVRLWDAATGQELRTFHSHGEPIGTAFRVAWSPDSRRLASTGADGTVKLWEAATGKELRSLGGHMGWVYGVAFSPDGTRLASAATDGTVRVWDPATGQEEHKIKGHRFEVESVVYSPDGTRLASASTDQTVRLWDVTMSQEFRTLKGHTGGIAGRVDSVAYSPDGTQLASIGRDRTVRIWDLATCQEVRTIHDNREAYHPVAYSPDGTQLASASVFGSVRVWDPANGQRLLFLEGHTKAVASVAYSPDGTHLASAGHDNTVRVWDLTTGQQLHVLKNHTGPVSCVVYSPDGTRLASTGRDNTVRVWDPASGQQLCELKGHTTWVSGVAFSSDGTCLASANYDGTVRLWDAATGKELRTLKGHTDFVNSVAYSPDGSRLASASRDGTVRVWDVATGQELYVLKSDMRPIRSVAFSPDGTRLASASEDGTIRIYDARPLTPELHDELEALGLVQGLFQRGLTKPDVLVRIRSHSAITEPVRTRAMRFTGALWPQAVRAQAAVRVNELFAEMILQEDVLEALRMDARINEEVRVAAMALAQKQQDNPGKLNDISWQVVREPGAAPVQYRRALRAAQVACRLQRGNGALLNTLGVAQYRVGQYRDALATLTQAEPLNAKRYQGSLPGDLAFLAMAHYQLGQKDDATTALSQLRERMKDPRWANDAESQAFLREAEALLQGNTMSYADP